MKWTDESAKVAAAVERAVMTSFQARPLPLKGITEAECRRRVQICEELYRVLRLEKRWSIPRIRDHLYPFLVATLDRTKWEPDTRTAWIPDSGPGEAGP